MTTTAAKSQTLPISDRERDLTSGANPLSYSGVHDSLHGVADLTFASASQRVRQGECQIRNHTRYEFFWCPIGF
jgi:hypothetical protein